jgi:hypothetical protein
MDNGSNSKRALPCRLAAAGVVSFATWFAPAVCAAQQSPTAQALVSDWKDGDPSMTVFAEVIASAFAGGFSWGGHLRGTEVYCPPPNLGGREIMSAFARFLENNRDMADRPYGAAMAATLRLAFPCQTN